MWTNLVKMGEVQQDSRRVNTIPAQEALEDADRERMEEWVHTPFIFSADAPAPVIVKEGWLYKRGEHIRNWRHRYFILWDNGQLLGFKTKPSTSHDLNNPVHTFTAQGCQIMTSEYPKPFTFLLRGLQMTTIVERTFHAETYEERTDWLEAIKNVKNKLEDEWKEWKAKCSRHSSLAAYETMFSQIGNKVDKSGNHKITFENFEFIKVLGRGTFGKVVLCREKTTNCLYAIKMIKKEQIVGDDIVEHTLTENRVLRSIKNPFVTGLKYSFTTEYRLCFVMEYVNGGDLFFHWSKEGKFSEDQSRFYGAEITSAIGYLHKKGIIYRDLKLENLLLDKDGHIKIADFGLCKEDIKWGTTTNTFCGTPEYIAPEVLENNDYGRAVDWWEFGVLMFEMMVGDFPFYHHNHDILFDFILMKKVHVPKDLTSEAKSLLEGLLTKDPELRLGGGREDAQEVMDHKFFACINWSEIEERKVTPPFKPEVTSETDTRYFDSEFTGECVDLTPPDSTSDQEGKNNLFRYFSYQDPDAELSEDTHFQTRGSSHPNY